MLVDAAAVERTASLMVVGNNELLKFGEMEKREKERERKRERERERGRERREVGNSKNVVWQLAFIRKRTNFDDLH